MAVILAAVSRSARCLSPAIKPKSRAASRWPAAAIVMGPGVRRVAAGFTATGGVARGADLIEQRLLNQVLPRGFLPPGSAAPEAG
jgi:hypothetical protein